jgi:hypothetical protein
MAAVEGHDVWPVLVEQVLEPGGVETVPGPVSDVAVLVGPQIFHVEAGFDCQMGGRGEREDDHVVCLGQETPDGHLPGQVAQADPVGGA